MEARLKKGTSNIAGNAASEEEAPAMQYTVKPERWRFIAYCFFWFMCFFAIVLTNIFVKDILAAGPEDGAACGPYKRNAPEFGVFPGEGFDFSTQSHLIQIFGYSNICTNWDYSPSRELTAMFYPLFEYSVLVYLALSFCATSLACKRGDVPQWFDKLSNVFFFIEVILCAEFRMCFVCLAYEDIRQHTAGFLGLQIALVLIALHNSAYVWASNITYKFLGGIKGTRAAIILYLICDLIISGFKVATTIHVVRYGIVAEWTLKPTAFEGIVVGQIVDWAWMLFNAVIPLVISFIRARHESPLKITIQQGVFYVSVEEDERVVEDEDHATTKEAKGSAEEDNLLEVEQENQK